MHHARPQRELERVYTVFIWGGGNCLRIKKKKDKEQEVPVTCQQTLATAAELTFAGYGVRRVFPVADVNPWSVPVFAQNPFEVIRIADPKVLV